MPPPRTDRYLKRARVYSVFETVGDVSGRYLFTSFLIFEGVSVSVCKRRVPDLSHLRLLYRSERFGIVHLR